MTGRSISEVAVRLNLSPKTVSTYHTRIWNKLGVRSDVAMARYALEHRLLDDS